MIFSPLLRCSTASGSDTGFLLLGPAKIKACKSASMYSSLLKSPELDPLYLGHLWNLEVQVLCRSLNLITQRQRADIGVLVVLLLKRNKFNYISTTKNQTKKKNERKIDIVKKRVIKYM